MWYRTSVRVTGKSPTKTFKNCGRKWTKTTGSCLILTLTGWTGTNISTHTCEVSGCICWRTTCPQFRRPQQGTRGTLNVSGSVNITFVQKTAVCKYFPCTQNLLLVISYDLLTADAVPLLINPSHTDTLCSICPALLEFKVRNTTWESTTGKSLIDEIF